MVTSVEEEDAPRSLARADAQARRTRWRRRPAAGGGGDRAGLRAVLGEAACGCAQTASHVRHWESDPR